MAENHSLHELQAPGSSKVFVQRDYSSGTTCRFHTKFPSELENRVDKQQFEETMQMLNNLYAEAEKLGGRSYLEGCLSCLTAYTAFLCLQTHYEKVRGQKVDKQQFEETMQMLNNLYAEAEKLGGRSYLEGCLSCLTAYTAFLCLQTHYEKIPEQ
ncbi:golgin subfamily A member 7-like [Eucyclogobius newberryi]|uniref:golgin subfamily A member 7-like n=1 Tax=Eucyclogobius newberryi TaxID=166745 RepID=UPI003B5CD492